MKDICRNGDPSLPGSCRVTDLGRVGHRILAVVPARNPGNYVLGSVISSLKLSFDSKRISSHVETHSLEG